MKKMKDEKPLVSIILPVHNAQNFLSESIESILNQTYKNFELIIVDDFSTDKSFNIATYYKNKYPQLITLLKSNKCLNKEGEASSNIGLSYAKGKYIARMDADDISNPTRIEQQVSFLETHPDIFLVASNAYIIDREGRIIGEKNCPAKPHEIYKGYLSFHLARVNPIVNPSSMFHRLLKNKNAFQYGLKYPVANDYYTLFKLICDGYRFCNLQEKLIYYRIHGQNNTLTRLKEKSMIVSAIRLEMVLKHGYKPDLIDGSLIFLQSILLSLIPQKLLLPLYLVTKGISKFNLFAFLFPGRASKVYFRPTLVN